MVNSIQSYTILMDVIQTGEQLEEQILDVGHWQCNLFVRENFGQFETAIFEYQIQIVIGVCGILVDSQHVQQSDDIFMFQAAQDLHFAVANLMDLCRKSTMRMVESISKLVY